ncbi:hypothetical protein E9O_09249 [Moraxella catarrhalis 12P80B1]|nr:hypothetical protein E9O_09249 [Moraxella catarrhalis 12P80B1]EGE21851.1 hypothetical protein E9S_01929 [Moraxella catarrhalis BC7]
MRLVILLILHDRTGRLEIKIYAIQMLNELHDRTGRLENALA